MRRSRRIGPTAFAHDPDPIPTPAPTAATAPSSARAERRAHPADYQQIEAFGYQRFTNREQSRLDFGARLLDLAEDDGLPLIERAKFLAIFSELLDEFYQIRVAALEDQVAAGVRTRSVDGLRPGEQLTMIRGRVEELVKREDHIFLDLIVPALADAGVRLSDWSSLDDDDRAHLVEVFQRQIFPVLTPLAVDPGHPFPYISNLSLNLVVEVQDPRPASAASPGSRCRRRCPASSSCPTASASCPSSRSSRPTSTASSPA